MNADDGLRIKQELIAILSIPISLNHRSSSEKDTLVFSHEGDRLSVEFRCEVFGGSYTIAQRTGVFNDPAINRILERAAIRLDYA